MHTQNRFFDDLARVAGAGLNFAIRTGERFQNCAPAGGYDVDLKATIVTLEARVADLERQLEELNTSKPVQKSKNDKKSS